MQEKTNNFKWNERESIHIHVKPMGRNTKLSFWCHKNAMFKKLAPLAPSNEHSTQFRAYEARTQQVSCICSPFRCIACWQHQMLFTTHAHTHTFSINTTFNRSLAGFGLFARVCMHFQKLVESAPMICLTHTTIRLCCMTSRTLSRWCVHIVCVSFCRYHRIYCLRHIHAEPQIYRCCAVVCRRGHANANCDRTVCRVCVCVAWCQYDNPYNTGTFHISVSFRQSYEAVVAVVACVFSAGDVNKYYPAHEFNCFQFNTITFSHIQKRL